MADDCCESTSRITVYRDPSYSGESRDLPVGGQVLPNVSPGDSDWDQIATGTSHSLGIKKDGSLWSWGRGLSGELGDGKYQDSDKPVKVSDGRWKSVACGEHYSLAVTESGDLYSWGANQSGQLGNGSVCDDFSGEIVSWAVANISSSVEDLVQPRQWGRTSDAQGRPSEVMPAIVFRNKGQDAGSGAAAFVDKADFRIKKVTVTNGGSGYTSPPSVSFEGGGGINASASAVVRGGQVVGVIPTSAYGLYFGSSLYDSAPQVVFSGGGGTGAQATAVMEGEPYSVKLTSGGSGYQNPPDVDWIVNGASILKVNTIAGRASTRLAASPISSAALSGTTTPPVFRPTPTGKVTSCFLNESLNASYFGWPRSRNRAGGGDASIGSLGTLGLHTNYSASWNSREGDPLTGPNQIRFENGPANSVTSFNVYYYDTTVQFYTSLPLNLPPSITLTVLGGGGSGTSYSVGTAVSTPYAAGLYGGPSGWTIPITMNSSGQGHVTDPVLMMEFVGWKRGDTQDFVAIKSILESAEDYRFVYTGMRSTLPLSAADFYGNIRTDSQPSGFVQLYSYNPPPGSREPLPVTTKNGYAPIQGGGGTGARVSVSEMTIPLTGEVFWTYHRQPTGGTGYNSTPDWPPNIALIGDYAVKAAMDVAYVPLVIDGPATSVQDLSVPKLYARPREFTYGAEVYGGYEKVREGEGGLIQVLLNNDANWRRIPGYGNSGQVVPTWDNSAQWSATVQGFSVQEPGEGYRARPDLLLVSPCGKPRLVGSGWLSVAANYRTSSGVKSNGECYWWGEGTGFYSPRLNGGEVRIVADVLPGKDVRYFKIDPPDGIGLPAFAEVRVAATDGWPGEYAKVNGTYPEIAPTFYDLRISKNAAIVRETETDDFVGSVSLETGITGRSNSIVVIAPERRSDSVRCVSVYNVCGGYKSKPSVTVVRNDIVEQLSTPQTGTYVRPGGYIGSFSEYATATLSYENADSGNVYPRAIFNVLFSAPTVFSKSTVLPHASQYNLFKSLALSGGSLFACGSFMEPVEMQRRRFWSGAFPITPQGQSDYGTLYVRQLSSGTIKDATVTYSTHTGGHPRNPTSGMRAGAVGTTRSVTFRLESPYVASGRAGAFLRPWYTDLGGVGVTILDMAVISYGATVTNSGTAALDAIVVSGQRVYGYSAGLFLVGGGYSDVLDEYAMTSGGELRTFYSRGPQNIIRHTNSLLAGRTGEYSDLVRYRSCFITTAGEYWKADNDSVYGEIEATVVNQGSGYKGFPKITSNVADVPATVSGIVRAIGLHDGGDGYTEVPSVTISGGGGSGASATAHIRGRVTGLSVSNSGEGYSAKPKVEFSSPGIPAEAEVVASGFVSQVLLRSGGVGYQSAPTVNISGGGGQGATATAVFSGSLSLVRVLSGGTGYSSPPSITFTGGGGSGAAATAVVAGGRVDYISITSPGSGYTSPPSVTFSGGGGEGADATARISGIVSAVTVTSQGSGYTSSPSVSFSGNAELPAVASCVLSMVIDSVRMSEEGEFSKFFGVPDINFRSTQQFSPYSIGAVSQYSFGENKSGGAYRSRPSATAVASQHLNSISVSSGGSEYSEPPEVRIWGGEGKGATAVAVLSGSIRKMAVVDQVAGLSSPPVAWFVSGVGSGATASVQYSGVLSGVSVLTGGVYESTPDVTVSSGNAQVAASFRELQSGKWEISSVRVTNRGGGYQSPPTITVQGGNPDQAASFSVGMSYSVTSVLLASGGSGYSTPPTLVINGRSVSARIVLSASVSRIDVVSEGEGFSSTPTIEIIGNGYGASATAALSSRGSGGAFEVDFSAKVLCVDVTSQGTGYTSVPVVTVAPPTASQGRGAVAEARCTFNATPPTNLKVNYYGPTVDGMKWTSNMSSYDGSTVNVNSWPWLEPPRMATRFETGQISERFFFPEMVSRLSCIAIDTDGAMRHLRDADPSYRNYSFVMGNSYQNTVRVLGGLTSDHSRYYRPQEYAVAASVGINETGDGYAAGEDSNGQPIFYSSSGGGSWGIMPPASPVLFGVGTPTSIRMRQQSLASLPNYDSLPSVVIHNETGTGCSVSVGPSLALSITSAGSGYTNIAVAKVGEGTVKKPTAAAATCIVSQGSITSVSLSSGGSKYTSAPSVVVQGGGGSGAVLQAKVAYSISAVDFRWSENIPPDDYFQARDMAGLTPVVSDEFEITPADIRWEKQSDGSTWSIRVVSGGLYTQKPRIAFQPSGSSFIPDYYITMTDGFVYAVDVVSGGSGFDQTPRLFFDAGVPTPIPAFTSFCDGSLVANKLSHCELPVGVDSFFLWPQYPKAETSFVFSSGTGQLFSPLYVFTDQGKVFDVYEYPGIRHRMLSGITSLSVSQPGGSGESAQVNVTRPVWKSPSSASRAAAVRTDA